MGKQQSYMAMHAFPHSTTIANRQYLQTQRGTTAGERQYIDKQSNMPAHDCLQYCNCRATPCQRHTWCGVVTKHPPPRCLSSHRHVAMRRTHDTPPADVSSTDVTMRVTEHTTRLS